MVSAARCGAAPSRDAPNKRETNRQAEHNRRRGTSSDRALAASPPRARLRTYIGANDGKTYRRQRRGETHVPAKRRGSAEGDNRNIWKSSITPENTAGGTRCRLRGMGARLSRS